jgi:exo-beta-1,3-glucanase (GH17 family)
MTTMSQPRIPVKIASSFLLCFLSIPLILPFALSPLASAASGGSRPPSNLARRVMAADNSTVPPLYGLDFSPYIAGQNPNVNPQVSAEQISARLQIIAPYTRWVRSFSITTGLENIPPIAHSLNLKVAAGAWISSDLNQNDAEVTSLIVAAQAGNVDMAIVGSEALLRNDVSESQLIAYMNQVREAIPAGIPVTTADTYDTLLAHPNVIAASDVIAANIYPYWQMDAISNAVCDLVSAYNQVVSAANGKQVIISETGWPSGGDAQGAAVPTPANEAQFLSQFIYWANANNVAYFYFEGLDEAWKASYEGPQGAYWGIWDENGVLKPLLQPALAGQTTPVSCNGVPGGPGTPQISFTYVPPTGSADQLEGQALHASTSAFGVAIYIQVFGGWWTKPYYDQPVTSLQPDGSWSAPIATGGYDTSATAIAAFLIPNSYTPPPLGGEPSLPDELYQNSVANVQTQRSANSISGRITDAKGNPFAGIVVTLSGAETQTPDGP